MPGQTKNRRCRVDGCNDLAVKGLWLCEGHLTARTRCTKIIKEELPDGRIIEHRCAKVARTGTILCGRHSSKRGLEVSTQTKAVSEMRRFATPFEGELNPLAAFEGEFRRTYGRILWLEDQLARLEPEDLIWGKTKEEQINAGSGQFFNRGTNTTHEARIHGYELMLRWERAHFLDLEKLWINAKLDQQKLNLMRDHIQYTYTKAIELARMLGHDPDSDQTREILLRLFANDATSQETSGGTNSAELAAR